MGLDKPQIMLELGVGAGLVVGTRLREEQLVSDRAGACAQLGVNIASGKQSQE